MQDPAATELPPGTELADRFTIEAPISKGAMGAVYRASDSEGGTSVAIKRLMDLDQAARFEIEARLLSQLRHPRVVQVLDYFQDDTGQYLVMDLVKGPDLGQLLKQRGKPGLPPEECTEYAIQACEALQYVHDQLIVHRDVKPQNMIVSENGIVLVDFGIARLMGEEDLQGTVGIGTPRFIAPEVFAGGAVSPRADVFGLAATLWTMLVGKPPVYADSTNLCETVPGVTLELEQTLRAGLELVPERRVASVQAFAHALGSPLMHQEGESLALSLDSAAGPDDLMKEILRTAAGVFDAAACSVALLDRTTGELVYQWAWGAGAGEIVGVRLNPGTGIGGSVVTTGEAEAVDCRNDDRFASQIAAGTGYVPYTMLVAPIKRHGKPIGVISLLDRRDGGTYGPADMDRATLFADLIATALDVQPMAFPSLGETIVVESRGH